MLYGWENLETSYWVVYPIFWLLILDKMSSFCSCLVRLRCLMWTEMALFCLQRPSVFKPIKTFDGVGNIFSQSSGGGCVMRIDPRQMRLYLQFGENENQAMRGKSTACSICQTVPECRTFTQVKPGKIFFVFQLNNQRSGAQLTFRLWSNRLHWY